MRKLRKVLIHKKYRRRFYTNSHVLNAPFLKFTECTPSILVSKIPLVQRVINDTNLELFYKLNKDTEEGLADFGYYLNHYSVLEEEEDFLIYLRNYHQKPYWKLRQSRVLH